VNPEFAGKVAAMAGARKLPFGCLEPRLQNFQALESLSTIVSRRHAMANEFGLISPAISLSQIRPV
jgi:hypothetical protein